MSLLQMCWEFFKAGLFAVGGGLATLPFLYDMADRFDWFTREDLSNMIAVAESTPGPMGVNMATYAGMTAYGLAGAILATCSLVFPSVVIIILISKFLEKFRDNRLVDDAFRGLRPASVGLVAAACVQVLQVALLQSDYDISTDFLSIFNWKAIILFAVLLVLYRWKQKWHPIVFVAIGAVVGIVLGM